jgi:hypothetical protein
MDIYVIEEGEKDQASELVPTVYRTFDEVRAYITQRAAKEGWAIVNDNDVAEPNFEEDNVNRYTDGSARPPDKPVGKTYIWGLSEQGRQVRIIVYKLKLEDATGGRKTARTIRVKKGKYLRKHHHLFKVLRNPTRRALK